MLEVHRVLAGAAHLALDPAQKPIMGGITSAIHPMSNHMAVSNKYKMKKKKNTRIKF